MKIIRTRAAAWVLALCVLVGLCPAVTPAAKADGPLDSSYMEAAVDIQLGTTVDLTLSGDEKAVYRVDVEAGEILTVVKQQPAMVIQLYDPAGEMGFSTGDSNALSIAAEKSGGYYLFCYLGNGLGTVSDSITVTASDNDAFEPNNTNSLAKEIIPGETVEFLLPCGDIDWFFVELTKPGQLITVEVNSERSVNTAITNVSGRYIASQGGTEYTLSVCGEHAGIYGIRCNSYEPGADLNVSLTVTVTDNDGNEKNNDMDSATEVTEGVPVELILGAGDQDWFKVTTTKPGQFIQVDISGFSDTNRGGVRVQLDEMITYATSQNATFPLIAAEAGDHYIKLTSTSSSFASGSNLQVYDAPVKLNMTVTVKDNDAYESNDDRSSAVEVTEGEPMELILGYEDQDWFQVTTTKPGQAIKVELNAETSDRLQLSVLDKDGNYIDTQGTRSETARTVWAVAPEAGVYYIQCYQYVEEPCAGILTVTLVDNDAYEPNDSLATAKKITAGESVNIMLNGMDKDWFAIDLEAGQFLTVTRSKGNVYVGFYGPDWIQLDSYGVDNSSCTVADKAGTYYIRCQNGSEEMVANTLTVTVADNDGNEPNGTKENATELPEGENVELLLGYGDWDWFKVTTTKPGQDIQIDISGFNYANKGSLRVDFDETIEDIYVSGNETLYFHAAEAGTHYIRLSSFDIKITSGSDLQVYNTTLKLNVSATVLDGDEHESKGSDSEENAVTLNLGTDETFNVGGWGDEDWFQFEVAPEEGSNNLYTLQFLDLNPDYSDEFYYEVYAPDGSLVATQTKVNIQHSNILACEQQGMYKVRVYSTRINSWGERAELSRSELRIRVRMGGDDPYENNDTWLEAKPLQPGQLTQHVLVSSTDNDWFYFTAEEADMSFALECDKRTNYAIYRAEDLAEFGSNASSIGSSWSSSYEGPYYHKLDGAGVYYLRLSSETAYASEELRSFAVTLEPHGGEENNDTWDKATPIYETMPQEFDIAGVNDTDWFKFTVPEGAKKVNLWETQVASDRLEFALYREQDIIQNGVSTEPAASWWNYGSGTRTFSVDVTPGVYYVKVWAYHWRGNEVRAVDCTLTYYLSCAEGGSSMETAVALEPGVWSAPNFGDTYYSLGELKAGDVVRYSRDGSGMNTSVYLYYSNGNWASDSWYANNGFSIPSDGEYYLRVYAASGLDTDGEPYTTRIRYDIGTGSDYATTLEGPDAITLTVGEKRFVDLRLAPYTAKSGADRIYLNQKSDYSVATFDSNTGYVTAMAVGTTTITFRAYTGAGYLDKTVTINVVEPVAATGVSISNAPEEMELGSSVELTAVLNPTGANEDVAWSSSDTDVLHVTPGGKVIAVGEGEATITAAVAAGSDSVTIKVVPVQATEEDITGLTLNEYALTMYMGEGTQKLTATVLPEGIAATVKWVSSNTAAATVDQNGVITAVGPGISVITASAGDHNTSCIVTVQAERVRVTGISFAEEKLQIPLGGQSTLLPTIEPYNATTKTLTWVSDDPSVATVSRTGIVNALAVGVTTIRATTMDGGFVAEITIEVTAKPQLGDINGDGHVDSADALMTLQVAVGLRTLTEEEKAAADVNKDGFVDAGDGVKILRYDAKLINSLE